VRRTALLLSWVVGLLVAIPAHAQSPIDEAVKSLQDNPVYVAAETEGTTSQTADDLASQLHGGDNILLVMLPATAGDPTDLAKQIDDATEHKYVIGVAVGDQLAAASAVMPQGTAADLMRRANSISTSNVETLNTFVRNVHSWQAQHPRAKASKPVKKKSDGGSSWILFVIIGLILVLAGLFVVLRASKQGYQTNEGLVQFKRSPEQVRDLLDAIMKMRGDVEDPEVRQLIDTACTNTEEYFRRSSASGKQEADAQMFVNHLQSVRKVLVQYIDIQNTRRRGYYDNPDQLMESGRSAIAGFNTFVLNSIKRGRSADLTNFKVDTDILTAQRFS
jgi:hypothetical protein